MSAQSFNEPSSQRIWGDALLQGCYHSSVVMESSLRITATDLFTVMHLSHAQVLLFEAMCGHYRLYKATVSVAALAASVAELIERLHGYTPELRVGIAEEIKDIVGRFSALPFKPDDVKPLLALVQYVYETAYTKPALAKVLQDGLQTGDLRQVKKAIDGLGGAGGTQKVRASLSDKKNAMSSGMPISSGLAWLDELLCGGFSPGDSYGVIGPTGGGKSTLCAESTCAMSAQGRKILSIMTEQRFDEAKMVDRYWALVTGKSCNEFRKHNDQDLFPPELVTPQDRVNMARLESSVYAYDRREVQCLEDLELLVAQHRPDIFFVDWAGTLADVLMAQRGNQWNSDRPMCLRAIANFVDMLAKKYATAGVVFQQLAPGRGLNPLGKYTHADSFECKSFCQSLGFGLVLSPKDENNVMRVACTKCRWGNTGEKIVLLDGEHSVMRPLDGYRRGKSKWVKSDMALMPAEKTNKKAEVFQ